MKIQSNDSTGAVVLDPLGLLPAKRGHTLRDVASIPTGDGALKWQAGALVRDTTIDPASLKPLSPRQFSNLLLTLNMEDADVEGFLASQISDPTTLKKALIDFHKAQVFEITHPLVPLAIEGLELNPQVVYAGWLAASKIK